MNPMEQEHYSFGPWLIEVKSEATLPPQYIEYMDEILSTDLVIKVPVNKDRRDVEPGMVLYKEVVTLKKDLITIYAYTEKGIAIRVIALKDVVYIIRGGELLFNYISIGTSKKEFRVDYYSVSQELTSKFIEKVRRYMLEAATKQSIGTTMTQKYSDLKLFRYFNHKELISKNVEILGYQQEAKLILAADNWQDRLINAFKTEKLDEMIFLTNAYELIIISGDIDNGNNASVDYSYRHCYIRADQILSLKTLEDDRYDNAEILNIDLGDNKLMLRVDATFDMTVIKAFVES